jgi:hypothetical protein
MIARGYHGDQSSRFTSEAKATSVYGPDSFANGQARLVGSVKTEEETRVYEPS